MALFTRVSVNKVRSTYKKSFVRCYERHTDVQEVPGLVSYNNFLNEHEISSISKQMTQFNAEMRSSLKKSAHTSTKTNVPQPKSVRSQNHNLSSEEDFLPLMCNDTIRKTTLQGAYFTRYGEDAHELAYFKGADNVPGFAWNLLSSKIIELPEVQAVSPRKDSLVWNTTLNYYGSRKTDGGNTEQAGFGFHKDIATNGDISVILSLGPTTSLEFKPDKEGATETKRIHVGNGAMIILTGDARWKWIHRVVPKIGVEPSTQDLDGWNRLSIVYGCK
mmetsp:Transcript_27218/g.30312  ORF Transcript_27218/g.30312 Transcript_27218/m.30312 type:complete len:275 (-) Transcript_27218:46-870(-)